MITAETELQALLTNGWLARELRYEAASLEQMFIRITAEQNQATDAA